MPDEEWIKKLDDGRKVKFIYQELPEDGAFITAQLAGDEVVYSVVLTKALKASALASEVGPRYCLTDCTCREAEKFLTAGLADVLKPGYETFGGSRFERGTCCELPNCQKVR
jgi:hypothetical protein